MGYTPWAIQTPLRKRCTEEFQDAQEEPLREPTSPAQAHGVENPQVSYLLSHFPSLTQPNSKLSPQQSIWLKLGSKQRALLAPSRSPKASKVLLNTNPPSWGLLAVACLSSGPYPVPTVRASSMSAVPPTLPGSSFPPLPSCLVRSKRSVKV